MARVPQRACLSKGGVAVYLEEVILVAVQRRREVARMRRPSRL